MPNVPMYDQRVRERAMPGVSAGPTASAESFGAGAARDVLRLGGAVHQLGDEALRQSQVKQRVLDEATLRDQTTQLHEKFARESQAIYQKRGNDAKGAEKEVAELADRLDREAREQFTTREQERAWDRSFSSFKTHEVERAISFSAKQAWEYDRQTYEAQNMTQIRLAQEAEASDSPEARDVTQQAALEITLANIDRLTQGMPEEARALARNQASHNLFRSILDTRAAKSPEEALAYLDQEQVAKAFPPAELKRLRDGYMKARQEASESATAKQNNLAAMEDAATGMTENEARQKYYSDPGLSEKQAEAKLNTFKATRTADNSIKISKQAERTEQLENAYAETGFNIANMPDSLKLTAKEQAELVKWGQSFQANGGKNPPPDINFLFKLDRMSQEELQNFLLDEANSEAFYAGVGGAGSHYAREYIDKAMGRKGKDERRPLTDTNAGWAAAKFAEDEGLVLGSARDSDLIKDFVKRYEVLAKQQAMADKLKHEDDLTPDRRNEIYQKMRVKGMYVKRPLLNTLSFGLLGNEERTRYDMLADEEADFENFREYTAEEAAAAADPKSWSPSQFDDQNFWTVDPDIKAPPATQEPEPPQAVLDTIGHKGNTEKKPILGADGDARFWEITEQTKNGKRIVYLDANGRAVSRETALAGRK